MAENEPSTPRKSSRQRKPTKRALYNETADPESSSKAVETKRKRKTPIEFDEEDDDEPATIDSEELSDYYSDAKESTSKHKAKKQKTKASRGGSSQKKRAAKLSSLPDLPLDLLFFIFGLLSPRDLVSLTRANQLLRSTLLADDAITVWKTAREATGAPPPMRDFTEAGWCKLIFGGYYCQICAQKTQKEVDWGIRKRICKKCTPQTIMNGISFNRLFDGDKETILALVPPARSTPHTQNGHYLREDVELTIGDYNTASRRGLDALNTFIQGRTKLLAEIVQNAALCEQWARTTRMENRTEKWGATQERRKELKRRLISLGHSETDADWAVTEEEGYSTKAPLTEGIWKRISPKLIATATKHKEDRVASNIRAVKASRRTVFEALYRAHLSQFTPLEWVLLPTPRALADWPDVAAVVDREPYSIYSSVSFEDILTQQPFAMRIDVWKKALRQCIADSPSSDPSLTVEQKANLAAMVYMRKIGEYDWRNVPYRSTASIMLRRNIAVTWDEVQRVAAAYAGTPNDPLIFDEELSRVSTHLINISGLDPVTATAADMDASAARFLCISKSCARCANLDVWQQQSRYKSSTWREMLYHHDTHRKLRLDATQSSHPTATVSEPVDLSVTYRIANPWEIRERASTTKDEWLCVWSCGHCNEHLGTEEDNLLRQAEVLEHVKEIHNIADPQINVDFVQTNC